MFCMVPSMIDAYAALFGQAVRLSLVMEENLRVPPNGNGCGLTQEALLDGLRELHTIASRMGFAPTAKHIDGLWSLVSQRLHNEHDLPADIKNIRQRFGIDAASMMLFRVEPDDVQFYAQRDLFGPEVAAKFPDAQKDLTEAGTCYALGCYTASAMHLMRALESALKTLAQTIPGFTLGARDTMGGVVSKLRTLVTHLPDGTQDESRRKQKLNKAQLYFDGVTSALRNPTMHSAEFWSAVEVSSALGNAKLFLQDLAEVV